MSTVIDDGEILLAGVVTKDRGDRWHVLMCKGHESCGCLFSSN